MSNKRDEPTSPDEPSGTTELEAVQIVAEETPQPPPPLPVDVLMPNAADAQQMRRSTARALLASWRDGLEFTPARQTALKAPETTTRESQEDLVAAVLAVDRDEHLASAPSSSPILSLATAPVPWHRIDYRSALLLARVDGRRTVDEVVGASGLSAEEAAELLAALLAEGLVVMGPA